LRDGPFNWQNTFLIDIRFLPWATSQGTTSRLQSTWLCELANS
jgi:hypothetical protein